MVIISICRILTGILLFQNSETAYELFSIGCQLELDGKTRDAIEYYIRARDLTPDSPEIYLSLANAYYKIGEYEKGISNITRGLLILPESIDLFQTLAVGYIGKQDYESAIEAYQKILKMQPHVVSNYASLSILYEAINKPEYATKILTQMPDSLRTSDLYTRLGSLAGKAKNHLQAIDYYRQAFAMDTLNSTAIMGIATGFDIINVKDSAIYYYRKSLNDDSLSLEVAQRLVELYSDTDQYWELIAIGDKILEKDFANGYIRRSVGYALYKLGMLNEAVQQFLITSRIDPGDTYSRFYLGRIYLEQGSYNAALMEINQALEIDPDFIELWIYLGFIALDTENYETAEYAFAEAAYRGGDLVQVNYLLGVTAEMQHKNSDAYYFYKKALRINAKNLASLEALANLCVRLDKEDEALEYFERIIEIDTTNAVALNYVGYFYAEKKDNLDYALSLIDRALAIEPANGYYIDSRGWVLYQMGRYEEALKELVRATEIVEDVVILEHLGDVYMKLEKPEQARESYQKGLELEPDNEALLGKLKNIGVQ